MFSELLSVFWYTWFNFSKNLFLKENRLEGILRSWKKTSELFMIMFLLIVSCHSEQAKCLSFYYQKTFCHKKGREVFFYKWSNEKLWRKRSSRLENVSSDALEAEIFLILETKEERKTTRVSEAVMFNTRNSRRCKAQWLKVLSLSQHVFLWRL